jgi:hypothetical protein
MRRTELLTNALLWTLLVCSIGFCAYLYPLPSAAIEESLAKLTTNVDPGVRSYVEDSIWRAWTTNAALFVTGLSSSILWILGSKSATQRWVAIALAGTFVMLCLLIIGMRAAQHESLIQFELSFLKQIASAGLWGLVLAELHRFASSIVSTLALISMFIVTIKGQRRIGE